MSFLRQRWQTAIESFWLIPALLLSASVLAAEVLVALDRSLIGQGIAELPFVNAIGPSGSRDLLAAIGGSMLGVAATSFSITISVIATASSTYGPRLVRNFMANRGNQIVLGTFGATFLYALLVLRTVREESSQAAEFVPHLAVTVAIALAVLDVAVLIYFIHHIADSIQVSTLASQVLSDLERSAAEARPEDQEHADPVTIVPSAEPVLVVTAKDHGYLQQADHAALVDLAADIDGFLRVRPRCGDHVVAGETLVEVWAGAGADDTVEQRIRRHLVFGRSRTPQNDLRYAVQQIVEMAVRALSPSTNDPYTAINAITELGTGLVAVLEHEDPGNGYRRDGEWRLLAPTVGTAELVDLSFDQLRRHAVSSAEVVLALLELGALIAQRTHRSDVLAAVHRQEEALRRAFAASEPDQRDSERVAARA